MSRRRRLEQGSLFALSLLPLMMAASGAAAQALPSGGAVTSGTAAIGYTSANDMVIAQTSGKAIISWGDFSIGQGQSVTFENGAGATLNRVTGANASNLLGTLNASGSVYLINPNGVIIGSTGVVNVGGGFVASTLNLTDANFLAGGTLTFEGPSTAVVKNLGRVGALGGDVALIAATVTNEGAIEAGGTAGLAAGSKVVVTEPRAGNLGKLSIAVQLSDSNLYDGRFKVEIGAGDVTNLGAIAAAEVELRANGGNVFALAGNTGGTIVAGDSSNNAPTLSIMSPGRQSGRVFLTAGTGNVTSSGLITASDAVTMQGAKVAIAGSRVETGRWTIGANDFTIGDAEATVLDHAMAYGAGYDPETEQADFNGANVTIVARTGDIVLDTTDVGLNVGDRRLSLTAFGNVTLHDSVSAIRRYDFPGNPYDATGAFYLRSDSAGTGNGVVSGLSLSQGYAQVTTNVADYSTYDGLVDAMATASPGVQIELNMLVNTYADLKRIATDNDGEAAAGRFLLSHDIDASASTDGGYVGAVLTKVFDGDGHSISNLHVTGRDAGLFSGLVGAQVSNLNLNGGSVTGSLTAGAVAGYADQATIQNVTSSMAVNNASVDFDASTGGIVGRASQSALSSVSVSGDVAGANKVGGIVGHANGSNIYTAEFSGELTGVDKVGGITGLAENTYLSSSQMTGSVTGENQVGGVAGIFRGAENYQLNDARVSGAVTGSASNVGGLVGLLDGGRLQSGAFSGVVSGDENTGGLAGSVQNTYGGNSGQLRDNMASGRVTGGDNTGGLVGLLGSGTVLRASTSTAVVTGRDNVGGAVGSNSSHTFYSVQASGAVTGSGRNVGGLVGSNNGTIHQSIARGDVVGAGGVGGLVGYSSGTIADSRASGAVTGIEIAYDGEPAVTSVGGLVGQNYYGGIQASSASGAVSGAGSYFGGLVGYFYGADIANSFATGAVSGQHVVGGLIGAAGNIRLTNSYATGAVTGGDYDGPYELGAEAAATGGLIGLSRDSTTIEGSYATGKVVGADNTGGLIGLATRNLAVQNSWATGDVTGAGNVGGAIGAVTLGAFSSASLANTSATGKVSGATGVGGLVGYIQGQSQYDSESDETYAASITINDSYASGAVSGGQAVGGLVGKIDQGLINIANVYETGAVTGVGSVGGLIGDLQTGITISDGYATGAVTGEADVGGLFGRYVGSLVSNLYWDRDSSGVAISRGNDATNLDNTTALTRDQAFDAGSYAFSDSSHWVFIDGVRPLLASEWSTTITNLHQLQLMAYNTSAHYTLGNDISAAQANVGGGGVFRNGFSSIGSLSGSLDGQGHKISNLTILSAASDVGLFGTIQSGGLVRDLSLVDSTITSTASGGRVGAIAGTNNGTITIVSNAGSVTGLAENSAYAGGLVGFNTGTVELSASKGAVSGGMVGGISGANSGTIANSYASGALTGSSKVGGITGELSDSGVLNTVLATGALVNTGEGKVGALVGSSYGNATVNNGRWSTTVVGPRGAVGGGTVTGHNNLGYSTADLQDETKTAEVYAGFDLNNIWALGSSAAVSGDGLAHFAELYRADNILVVDARTSGTYGSNGFVDGYGIRGHLRGDDALDVSVDDSAFGSTTHAGTYQLNIDTKVTGDGSYRIVKLGTLTINKRQVYVDLKGGLTKTYDGADAAVLTNAAFALGNVMDGDSLTITGTGTYASNGVGSGLRVVATNLVLGGASASDYELVLDGPLASNVGYINHALVTGTANATKTYDGTTALGANATIGFTGLVGDETLAATFTDVAFADKNAGATKVLTGGISVDLTGSNYAVTSFAVAGTGQINAKTLTAGLGGTVTKTYDGTTTATLGDNLALSGLVQGDTVLVGATGAAYADKNAGAGKTVTVNGVTINGADAGNYVLASTTASANVGVIGQKALTITANGQVKNRNDADPALTYVSAGLVAGDSLNGALTREAGETVGTYGILQGTLSGGGNYAVTYNRALLTINLGIPPVENLVIPYIPAEGGGSTTTGGSSGSGGAGGQRDGGTSVGFQLAVQETGADPSSTQEQGGDDTTACAAGEACHSAPYTQGGSTSGAIHFQGFVQ